MSTPAKLKKQAIQHEHDRQYEKALAIYVQLLDGGVAGDDEIDVALFNRAGDLALRAGDAARAVTYYERAVDLYGAGGLLNNAIALCNKILRHAPDRIATHYSLGVLHAKQGFRGDAKHHFVEYADGMHRGGRDDEALRALREFADLCAPGDDARTLLAQHLTRAGAASPNAAALQAVFDAGVAADAPADAVAGAARGSGRDAGAGRLVFLDLSGDAPAPGGADADDDAALAGPLAGLDAAHAFGGGDAIDAGGALDLLTGPADEAWPTSPDGFAGTAWDDGALDTPTDRDGAPGDAQAFHATALPGELPMLTLPLPAAAVATAYPVAANGPRGAAGSAIVLAPDLPSPEAAGDLPFMTLDEPEDGWRGAHAPADVVAPTADLDLLDLDADPVDSAPPAAAAALGAPSLVAAAAIEGAEPADRSDVAPVVPVAGTACPPEPVPSLAPRREERDGGVDLGEWLRESEAPRTTRMVTAEPSQTGDEQADFERMLDAFRAGVERNIDGEDFDSHYDLGVAFREMGLLAEAVTQFQRASRAPGRPLRAIEALGQCFVDLGQPDLALEALRRAAPEGGQGTIGAGEALADEQLVGVLYLLGVACEQTQRPEAAGAYYRRVLATDIQFRDASRRLAQLPSPPR